MKSEHIFVCHASADADSAALIVHDLEARGYRCWIAPRDVRAGQDYASAILDALERAGLILLVYSSHTDASQHVRRELDHAVSEDIEILPVRIEASEPTAALRYFTATTQFLDAHRSVHRHADEIASAIEAILGAPDSPAVETAESHRPSQRNRRRHLLVAGMVSIVAVAAGAVAAGIISQDEPSAESATTVSPTSASAASGSRSSAANQTTTTSSTRSVPPVPDGALSMPGEPILNVERTRLPRMDGSDRVAVGDGYVWSVDHTGDEIYRYSDGVRPGMFGDPPGKREVTYGAGKTWLAGLDNDGQNNNDGWYVEIIVVDDLDQTAEGTRLPLGDEDRDGEPFQFGVTDDLLVFRSPDDNLVLQDPGLSRAELTTVAIESTDLIQTYGGTAWLYDRLTGDVRVIGPGGEITDRFQLEDTPISLAGVIEGSLWAVVDGDRIVRLDPITGTEYAWLETGGSSPLLAAGPNGLWVFPDSLQDRSELWWIDPFGGRVVNLGEQSAGVRSMAADDSFLYWITGDREVLRIREPD